MEVLITERAHQMGMAGLVTAREPGLLAGLNAPEQRPVQGNRALFLLLASGCNLRRDRRGVRGAIRHG